MRRESWGRRATCVGGDGSLHGCQGFSEGFSGAVVQQEGAGASLPGIRSCSEVGRRVPTSRG